MIPWNYNIYGIATADYLYYTDENPIGTLLNETTYGYFYDGNPLYSVNRDKKLDESIYLWHIGAGSSAGTNAAFCLSTGDTLELQCAYNQPSKVPLAMQLCNVDTRDFYKDPKARLCYDFLEYTWINYYKSKLFVDINRTKFCVNPRIRCYNTSNNAKTTRTLTDIVSYINGDPDHRYVYLMYLDLYNGENTPRGTEMSYVPSESVSGNATPDILIERPIPDNAEAVKLDLQYLPLAEDNPQETWINDRQYSPFTQAIPQAWYDGVLSLVMPYCIGELLQNTVSQIRTGRKTATYNSNRITGGFMHVSTKVQEFDDVTYQWQMHNIYEEGFIELDNGFPLDTLTSSHHITTVSLLHIIDKKDAATMGEAVQRALKHEIAFYGFYFADSENEARNATLGTANDHIFLPELVNGTTTGNYFTGSDIPNVPYANATSVSSDYFRYNEEETGSDSGDLTTHTHSGTVVSSARILALDAVDMTLLSQWLNLTYKPDDADLTADFKGVNPADYIVSIRYYPFQVPASTSSVEFSVGGIKVEYNNVGSSVSIIPYEYGEGTRSYYDLGSFVMQPPYCFGDFRDNYIKLQLYIPWCGYVDLDPAVYCQSPDNTYHTISAAIQIDFCTGAAMGLVYRDGLLMETINGTVGVDIPLSAIAQGSYQTAIKQAEIALKQSKLSQAGAAAAGIGAIVGTVAAAATGGAAGVALGALGMANSLKQMYSADVSREAAEYNIDHVAPSINNVSAASPFNGALSEQAARIFIYKPATLAGADLATYGNTVGFACCKAGKLSDFHGLTVCSNVKLDAIDAPAHHKAAIQQALIKGVYLP